MTASHTAWAIEVDLHSVDTHPELGTRARVVRNPIDRAIVVGCDLLVLAGRDDVDDQPRTLAGARPTHVDADLLRPRAFGWRVRDHNQRGGAGRNRAGHQCVET